MDLTLLVLGHKQKQFERCPKAPHIRHVYLPALNPDNSLAESRVFHTDVLDSVQTKYVGLCTQRWDDKYRRTCRPLARLHELPLRENRIWAAAVTGPAWLRYSELMMSGMLRIMRAYIDHIGRRMEELNHSSFWSNNFIAHRGLVLGLAAFHRQFMAWFLANHGPDHVYYPNPNDLGQRTMAYFVERLTMAYFCLYHPNAELRQITL